jgi:conjugative relaxase-like TrwC/TraI family protein
MLTIRAMTDGKGYSARHLEHSDYYAEGERVKGRWCGRGAELLGLQGDVRQEEFEALREGVDPETGTFLRQRQSADRTGPDGEVQSHGRHLYDFTISAPKSVSIMAIVGGDSRLIEAHQRAVGEALQELEKHAATRVRMDGANADRITGNLAIAVYHHDTSRELDPQLHVHAVAANLTYDGAEGRWKALQASGIYERRAYLTEVYRSSLGLRVRALGYEIENRRDSKGRDGGFEIRGVSRELLDRFSQRSQQRDAAIRTFVAENGRQPTDNEVAVLVRETRADKLTEISTEEVRSRQRGRLTREEIAGLGGLLRSPRNVAVEPAAASLKYGKDHIFERLSVARDHEVLTEALRHGRGKIDYAGLKGALAMEESSGLVLRDGHEIATAESLQRERDMIDRVNRGIGRCERLGGVEKFIASDRLRPEQKRVVEFVLDSRDRVVAISGAAGTGKTATLQELRRGFLEARREVLAVAPTMSAVEELQKVGFLDAMTVERLLQDRDAQQGLRRKVLILDEAGMVSGRQMSEFLRLAEAGGARVVFSGDTRQIQSVEACDALRILEKESRLKSIALTQVQRQTQLDYRDAIQELRRDPERGFEKLDAMGAVHEVAPADRAKEVARQYSAALETQSSVLVVCATHDEIERVTAVIRAERIQGGAQLTRDVPLNWTTAQKGDLRNFSTDKVLGFHRAVKGIAKNETVEVVRVADNGVVIRNANGEERTLTTKQAKSFEVYERRSIEVATGDRLLLTANRREKDFRATNGEIVTVSGVDPAGRISLEDGRVLPAGFRQFTHGYAVTAHRSQGKSVDAVIISGDGMRKELFYVAASRGRQTVHVITSDKESLRESVARSSARKSASELARKAGTVLMRSAHRGIMAARHLAMRLSMRETESVPAEIYPHEFRREQRRERDFGR